MLKKPTIAVTMGDPAGIGPEVAVRASERLRRRARLVAGGRSRRFSDGREAVRGRPVLPIVDRVNALRPRAAPRPSDLSGRRGGVPLDPACRRARAGGEASAIVTAPVSKQAIQALGIDFPGHTETIASLAAGAEVRMMMAGATLRVVLVTTHVRASRRAEADHPRQCAPYGGDRRRSAAARLRHSPSAAGARRSQPARRGRGRVRRRRDPPAPTRCRGGASARSADSTGRTRRTRYSSARGRASSTR